MRFELLVSLVLVSSAGFVVAEGKPAVPPDADDAAYPAIERFVKTMEMVRGRHPDVEKVTYERLVNHALEGMMTGLDPFSAFYHPEMAAQIREGESEAGLISSIGMSVALRDDGPYVYAVNPHGAAADAGVLAGSGLMEIDGLKLEKVDFGTLLGTLQRPAGVTTLLKMKSRTGETRQVSLVHRVVPVRSVGESKMLNEADGYLRLAVFGNGCAREVESALDELEEKGMKRLLLDLRGNGGGSLAETVKILGLFLEPGTAVVTTRGRATSPIETLKTPSRQRRKRNYPIVVFMDRMSASASELTAGALQDLKRATIVGEKSFGKGSVQNILPLAGRTMVRLTIAKYYTPAGKTPDGKGITPDVEIVFSENDRTRFNEKIRFGSLAPEQRKAVESWIDPCIVAAAKLAR